MTKPLFASKWFKDVPAVELRQEIQNLYREIARLKGEDVSLAEGKVDRAGDTMTGELYIQDPGGIAHSVLHEGNYPIAGGTWTPVLGGSTSDPSVTYSNQVGIYVRVGPRLVWVFLRISLTSVSGGSGNIHIKGFPFTITNINNGTGGILACETSQVNYPGNYVTGRARSTDNAFDLIYSDAGAGQGFVGLSALASNAVIAMSGLVHISA